jgi:hypothetical protein
VFWGDLDNDGDLDLSTEGSDITRVFRNEGGAIGATWFSVGGGDLGDFDNDGILDIAMWGVTGVYVRQVVGALPNTRPTAPTGLSSSVDSHEVTLSWGAANDAETPSQSLTYNLRVGTTSDAENRKPGMSIIGGSDDGMRLVPAMGNVQLNRTWKFAWLPNGSYYWSVQAVDTAYAGSVWSEEGTFLVGLPAPTVSSITPSSGPVAGNTQVSVTGTGFQVGATVSFDGTSGAGIVILSETEIECFTPPHAAGAVDVVVTNTDSKQGTLLDGFTYY